jgi:DNA-directed RNA polymerase alpha subunit
MSAVHFIKIESLPATVRLRNVWIKANIYTVGDLLDMTTEEILNIKNFGDTTMLELDLILWDLSFSFLSTEERGYSFSSVKMCAQCGHEKVYDGSSKCDYCAIESL